MMMITAKAKSLFSGIKYYHVLIAVAIAAAFFSFAFFEKDSPEVIESRVAHRAEKKERTKYLNGIKEITIGLRHGEITEEEFYSRLPEVVDGYEIYADKSKLAFDVLKDKKEAQRFFDFESLYFFLGESWAIGLLIFCCIAIFYTFLNKIPQRKGVLVILFTLLYCALFYTEYLFLEKQDFTNQYWYYFSLCLTSAGLIIGLHFYALFKSREVRGLKSYIRRLNHHILIYIPERYVPDMKAQNYDEDAIEVVGSYKE